MILQQIYSGNYVPKFIKSARVLLQINILLFFPDTV